MKPVVLLLGGSGQLGTELRRESEPLWSIVAPDRAALDVTDADCVARLVQNLRPQIVINTTALQLLDICESHPKQALAINADAVDLLARAARDIGARFVTISTDYVFDGARRTPYRETDATNPIQAYGRSKEAGERAALSVHPEGAFVIRTCGLYGRSPSRQKGNFVVNRLSDALATHRLEVGCDLRCTPTSAADLARAIPRLLASGAPAGLYHLTNDGGCDWATFTAEVFRLAGVRTRVVPVDRGGRYGAARRPAYSVLDGGHAAGFGIVLRPWQEAVADYVREIAPR